MGGGGVGVGGLDSPSAPPPPPKNFEVINFLILTCSSLVSS